MGADNPPMDYNSHQDDANYTVVNKYGNELLEYYFSVIIIVLMAMKGFQDRESAKTYKVKYGLKIAGVA